MHPNIRRGYVETDQRDFAPEQVILLQKAQKDIIYLVDHDYNIMNSVTFVGNHFQLSARQRTALTRATVNAKKGRQRRQACIQLVEGRTLYIDGFNLIITLEAALSPDTTILRCMDGTVRDICGLRGTYKLIESTTAALHMIGNVLTGLKVKQVVFYLDAPVSNSGRLRAEILEVMAKCAVPADVKLVSNADARLWDKECVVSSDSIILDRCCSWINLAEMIIAENLAERRIIDLSNDFQRNKCGV